ncbi:MAG: FimB/Mfa2 family fimbrial subunit [Prevotella sp.]|nr:FimB/Mfa2 family fimbrial subunit [Prevotella sp.]
MRNFILMAGMILLAASCSNDESLDSSVNLSSEQNLVPVTVSVSSFSVSQSDFSDTDNPQGAQATTRATAVGDYDGVQKLTLAFYNSDGTEQLKVTHTKGSMPEGDTFGEFSTTLPLGSYTMVVLGYVLYDDDELTLTSPTQAEWTVNAPRETFAATQEVNVTSTTALNLSATLDRIVAQLKVISTDKRTANVEKVRMTFAAGGKQFSPTTGLATVNTGSVSTVNTGVKVGERSCAIGYVFLQTDEQTMDVTIETLDADGNTIFSRTVNNVPFKRNRCTKLTGSIYPTAASTTAGSFQVSTEWIPAYDMNF